MHVLTFDLVERLGDEGLDGFEALHHKAQRGELTAAVRDELIGQRCREDLLKTQGLEAREGRPCGRREHRRTTPHWSSLYLATGSETTLSLSYYTARILNSDWSIMAF